MKRGRIYFEALDPQEYLIVLTKKTWFGHVLRTDERAFRTGRFTRNKVRLTLESPEEIRQNRKSGRRNRVYLREWRGTDPLNAYLRVTAWIHKPSEKEGFITSVVPYVKIPPLDSTSQEESVWPKQS
jgi:hypothetical protein